jgi:hypothetical protein
VLFRKQFGLLNISGADIMILKMFLPKILTKNWHFLAQTTAIFANN